MSRWVLAVAFVAALGACTSGAAPSETTRPTTTTRGAPDRTGLIGSPALIDGARRAGALDATSADRYAALSMFSGADLIPFEYLVPAREATGFERWDHGALTRLVDRWDTLDGGNRVGLAGAVEGLAELVGPLPDAASAGCVELRGPAIRVCAGVPIVRGVSGPDVEAATATVRPWVQSAARASWDSFVELFGAAPELVEVRLVDITASGAFAYRRVSETAEQAGAEVCHLYVDVLAPESDDPSLVSVGVEALPDGVPLRERVEDLVAHQMFHCFARSAFPEADGSLVEGAATWAESHVYPERDIATEWMAPWVFDPTQPFTQRSYDLAFPFSYADRRGPGPDSILAVLAADSIDRLAPDFGDLWHEISVATWALEPVTFVEEGSGDGLGLESALLAAESGGVLQFDIPMFSRGIQALEFDDAETTDFARLVLDLSDVPDDVRITAVPETAAGPLDPVPLDGPGWVFCRASVGPCHEATTTALYTRIVLIATNVDNGDERFEIPWNTFNPKLDGTWTRVQGPISTVGTSPFWIVGTGLVFDEPGSVMSEDAAESTFTTTGSGWACALSGGYSVLADPFYGPADGGSVSGTITVTGEPEGDGFTTECVVEEGTTLPPISVPIFDAAGDTFGFEIRDYDTLWIYGEGRIYLYERSG